MLCSPPGAHRAWGQTPANYLATYEFNAYYADQIEASPSDIDVSPHQLTEADDVTAGNRKPAREAPKLQAPLETVPLDEWSQFVLP